MVVGAFGIDRRRARGDEVALGGPGGEDAVVGELVLVRVGHSGNQALNENEGSIEEGLGAVALGGAEFP